MKVYKLDSPNYKRVGIVQGSTKETIEQLLVIAKQKKAKKVSIKIDETRRVKKGNSI